MDKPNPLQSLFKGFKIFTIAVGKILSCLSAVTGLLIVLDGNTIGLLFMAAAGFLYWCANSINSSLEQEEKTAKLKDDDDFNLPTAGA
jgi:hypothetical protein